MAKDKLSNLLNFKEYDNLQSKKKPTKKTEVGGFAVLEHHIVGKDDQIDFIKKNLENCGKKKIQKIYELVENCLAKKETKEKESEESEEKDDDKSED